jgi:hypothetical protein
MSRKIKTINKITMPVPDSIMNRKEINQALAAITSSFLMFDILFFTK